MDFTPDIVLNEINLTKREKEVDQARLAKLVATKENLAKAGDLEGKLKELCAHRVPDLDNCTCLDKRVPTPIWT